MKYLILYYDRLQCKYIYRIFSEIENAFDFRQKILKSGLTRVVYLYKLYGRSGECHLL